MPEKVLPTLRDVIAAHGLRATKKLGQHFLLDMNITHKIVREAGDLSGCTVFEIGPGPGGLTRALLASDAAHIIAVERDRRCCAALHDLVLHGQGKLKLLEADALKVDLTRLAPAPRAIVANLPYNIGTELLVRWLLQGQVYRSITIMLQQEVVDRLLAKPDTKAYGRLSVLAQFCCDGKKVMTLPAGAFTPPPKVTSAVIRLTPKPPHPTLTIADLEQITLPAFTQRRKTLRVALKSIATAAHFEAAEIDPQRRAETLNLAEFIRLAHIVRK